MASALAAQLSVIAAKSTNSLNLKAQKAAHGQSIIFEPRVAASQTFETIYNLCHEGFQELCRLDHRFLEFQRDLFGERSQEQDRTQMTAEENAKLNKRLELFLGLVGARLNLNPAIKAVEWLVRRFRVHHYNTEYLLTTWLPYHSSPVFTTLLSILPSRLPESFKFLAPYIRSMTPPSRRTIVAAATKDHSFAALINSYVLRLCKIRHQYSALLLMWVGVMTEAIGGMLDKARSGRALVQTQNEQDLMLKFLPILNDGLSMKGVPDLQIGCYMLLHVLASKGGLNEKLLTTMMEAVALGWSKDTIRHGLICLTLLAQQRRIKRLPRQLTKELLKINRLTEYLNEICQRYSIEKFAMTVCMSFVHRLEKTRDAHLPSVIQDILQLDILKDEETVKLLKSLLLFGQQLNDDGDPNETTRRKLADIFSSLISSSDHMEVIVRRAFEEVAIDMDELEMKLKAPIRQAPTDSIQPEGDLLDAELSEQHGTSDVGALVKALAGERREEPSFLLPEQSDILFDQLYEAFSIAVSVSKNVDEVLNVAPLHRDLAFDGVTYFSFLIKIWCGPYPVLARAAALNAATARLREARDQHIDFQALIPYALAGLSDSALKARKAAAQLLLSLAESYSIDGESRRTMTRWATNKLYGSKNHTQTINWMSSDQVARFLQDILIPSLEECLIDNKHAIAVFDMAFNSSKPPAETSPANGASKASQALRASILSSIASHIFNTPLYSVKLKLLTILTTVRGVASTTRTKFLLPCLEQCASLSLPQIRASCEKEQISLEKLERQAVTIVVANDTEGLNYLLSIVKGVTTVDRPSLVTAAVKRLRDMWPSFKGDLRVQAADTFLEIALSSATESGSTAFAQNESADLLRSIPLPVEVLDHFLASLPTATKLDSTTHGTKRRRLSLNEMTKTNIQDSKVLTNALEKTALVLQLIDSSNFPELIPLVGGLFNVLAELQLIKNQVESELAYLQGLVLNILLSIIGEYKVDQSLNMDRSAVRVDLLIDCVQKTSSPQVQNTALLLIASLANTVPDLVLHNVMPIFTFMGSSVLRQNDEYSAHIIKQTIEKVVPQLISSLRREKGRLITGAAELLLSFVAAYEHIPVHRRKDIFFLLVQKLGPEDFLFAVLAMLANKYGSAGGILTFLADLSSSFSVEVQLQATVQQLDLIFDLLKPRPTVSGTLLNSNDSMSWDPQRAALDQLSVSPTLLSQNRLVQQTEKLLKRDDMHAARLREIYSNLLEKLLELAELVNPEKKLQSACGDVLEAVLGLLSTTEFIKSVDGLLDRPNENLRRKILRSLEVRIDQEKQSNITARRAMLSFLPQLTAIIRDSQDISYKHIAVACVDKIAEKYGKKDLEAVAAATQTIASDYCLGQADSRLRIMSLLSLASLTEILKDGIVPVLPAATSWVLKYLEESVLDFQKDFRLHDAGYSFMSALAQHLPYMISAVVLDRLLLISGQSAQVSSEENSDDSRRQFLQLVAKRVDAKALFSSFDRNWNSASDAGPKALCEYLETFSTAIDVTSKPAIAANSSTLCNIFVKALDLRRRCITTKDVNYTSDAIVEIEGITNNVAIKMIYKFNDTTFRPLFASLIEWAASGLPKTDENGRSLRFQSVFNFLKVFFANLKSIVTSYATYFLDNAVQILTTVNPADNDSRNLWNKVLQTLSQCFQHDQDDFWQSPAHFDLMAPALLTQFSRATSLPIESELIPAILEFAVAANSVEHHKEVNTAILKHLRSETAAIRLAAVQCQQALTDKLGEEWLAMLPEMLPYISELQEDDDDNVERETQRWIVKIEGVLGERLDSMLQ